MNHFFRDPLAENAMTSVSIPERINALLVRCRECNKMIDVVRAEGRCSCGAELPEQPVYW